MGGDWYDIITLRDSVVGVVIGDVAGHNTAAAAAMGQVRDALRAYAVEGHRPSVVLRHANRLIRTMRLDIIATCCYLELDVTTGTGTAVLAGHPPPILRDGDDTRLLPVRPDVPLGTSLAGGYHDHRFVVPPGAVLLLYTDGLVEDRGHFIDRGLSELCEAVRTAPGTDPTRVLDHILASQVGPQPRGDDIALLCLTRPAESHGDR